MGNGRTPPPSLQTPSGSQTARNAGGSTVRDLLIDAGEEVILRDGFASFTLDAVAARAKVSKGGLLHHFPGKDKLLDALVKRQVDGWMEELESSARGAAPGPGRLTRGMLDGCIAKPETWNERMRRSGAIVVMAMVTNPTLVEPLRVAYKDLQDRLNNDGLPKGVSEAVLLAMDGLWLGWIFGLQEATPQRLASIRGALKRLVDMALSCESAVKTRDDGGAERAVPARAARSRSAKGGVQKTTRRTSGKR